MEELHDAENIQGLPTDWIDCHAAAVRLCDLMEQSSQQDHGDDKQKSDACAIASFQRAFLTGELRACAFDGDDFKVLPHGAFANTTVVTKALQFGQIEIDPLWPDEWLHWNGKDCALPKAQFESWLYSNSPSQMDGQSTDNIAPDGEIVSRLDDREPPARNRVSLSEAVSWIAFGLALDAERLERALHWSALADGDLQNAQSKIKDAVDRATQAASDSDLVMFGRHLDEPSQTGGTNDAIQPHRLDDYRMFLIGRDDLYYGAGLKRTYRFLNDYRSHTTDRRDIFSKVTVDRAQLISLFPSRLHGNHARTASKAHSDDQRRQWMADQPMMDADAALAEYKKHPLYDGTKQAAWRPEWREVKGTKRGRPFKSEK